MEASSRAVIIVDRAEAFESALTSLRSAPRIGVDTESNGFYSYVERVCLIQISTEETDYIFDPLKLDHIPALGEIFCSPQIEKIFHGADYDIVSLKRDYRFEFSNIFDTVVACKLLEGQEVALSKLLLRYLGIELDKTMQRSDWGKRPLSSRQLEYAALDARYLLTLSDIIKALLAEAALSAEAESHFARLCAREWKGTAFNPEGYKRIAGYYALDPRARGVLRRLYELRERWAQRMDRPPFKVLGNQSLVHLALHCPSTPEQLRHSKGFPRRADSQLIAEVLQALELDEPEAPPEPPAETKKAPRRRRRRRRRPNRTPAEPNSNAG